MLSLYGTVRLLHLASMAVWLGAGLLAPDDVRESVLRGAAGIDALMPRLRRTARVMNASAYGTVASGLGLITLGRGWATPARIWCGLGLTLVAIGIGRVLIRPAVGALVGARATLDALPAHARAQLARRFALAVRAEDAVRAMVLVVMLA
jgi:hypothetical protein